MKQNALILTENQGVATLTLNRPEKRNAFDDNVLALFIEYLEQLAHNTAIRTIVIRGEGEHFCAGADITWMQKAAGYSFEENLQDALHLAQLMQLLYEINKPTIALVQGSVYGGGIGLVACSDIVLASPNTKFCFSEVKLGLVPAVVGPYVVQAIGQRAAARYMLTAEVFEANTALTLGLVHEVVAEDAKEERLSNLCRKIQANGPNAVQQSKEMLHYFSQNPKSPAAHVAYTTELIASLRASQEAKEGFSAFLEKRQVNW